MSQFLQAILNTINDKLDVHETKAKSTELNLRMYNLCPTLSTVPTDERCISDACDAMLCYSLYILRLTGDTLLLLLRR